MTVVSFDSPQVAAGFDAVQAIFNRHYAAAIAEGFIPGKAETQAAIRTIQEAAEHIAIIMHRRKS